ncbi:probable LRR receptor-like serine/threonine-protein kinase At1g53440 isoform X2 [Asparagus officinalis]|uniref:probable LRR receptor-like serine/threonine-protein kinase At1g53440 isoform X2 n=1 Tax=Asparagus officinalis TaxID=4686 RepID=UPI00098E31AB|nr:probable LRR receptor-like serine/threonine-protein kinase At1g53440 isoform X2 [Asparagus officinalis]
MRAAKFNVCLVILTLSFFYGGDLRCEAQSLPQEEIDALKQIGAKLKMQWNFSVDPCSGSGGWVKTFDSSYLANNLTCDCNNATNICHVTSIQLRGLNLTGVLPVAFANLKHLTFLDLTRNYLSGSIPAEWASLPLTNISLLGNRVSGKIPDELGNMSTLQSLVLDANKLEGPIPATIGKLTKLSRLFLASNNFSGELPESLGNLKNMSFFLIDGNPISGKIPSFIGNWTQLQRLDMRGTSLEGPFPPTFANLTSLSQLRVTDIRGITEFPPLQNMKSMNQLVLRNLSISGQLPDYIGDMTNLFLLDLSFNNLSGDIPGSFSGLRSSINYMFLSNNMLNGTIPSWILSSSKNLDISYNNFTGSPAPSSCQQGNVDLASSYSSTSGNLIETCLQRNFPCSGKPRNYNLFINCGGRMVTIEGNDYEDDSSPSGASRYYSDNSKWASTSTGYFSDNTNANYIATNTSMLNMSNPELYTTARLAPASLRYFGLCLQKGNYNVSLHFAEIVFTNDQTFSSNGRRIFDVSIQGRKVLQDFNIAKEANGTGKNIIKSFNTDVDHTLEISFYWAGKGTNSIPQRGVYGPLVSAISVIPNFKPDTGNGLSVGAIVSIVAGACALIMLIAVMLLVFLRRKRAKNSELEGLELHTSIFSLKQIKASTNNFDPANKIGEGGFGPVYKGVLPDGSEIAVKQLSSKSKQGNREFITEIGMISALQHPNLVKLHGCGMEGNQLLLVYEYMENNSLARALFGPEKARLKLDWKTRYKICLGIAKGLAYLHEESRLKIVHRDIKATNILLDKDLNAKISDFGLAKLDEEENTHISTRIAGTIGYMAPEYAMRGYLTDKADVYSFGVVTLEIVSGTSNTGYRPKEDFTYLLDWLYVLQEQGRLLELVDPNLGSNYSNEEAMQMLNVCLLCTNPSPTLRPLMSEVVTILEGKRSVKAPSMKPAALNGDDLRYKSLRKQSHDSQTQSISDLPWTDSSISAQSTEGDILHSSSRATANTSS